MAFGDAAGLCLHRHLGAPQLRASQLPRRSCTCCLVSALRSNLAPPLYLPEDGHRTQAAARYPYQEPPTLRIDHPSFVTKTAIIELLQRAPSAPYPHSQAASQSARDIHHRTGSSSSAYGSSTSSLERPSASYSPTVATTNNIYSANAFRLQSTAPPTSDSRPNDLIGAPFDASGILSSIQSTANGPTSAPSTRPDFPSLTHANTSPSLGSSRQQSAQSIPPGGQPMMETTPPRSENGTLSPKRFSGEAQLTKPAALRKKSGFSSFVNSMLGSPRTIKISAPENPMHMIHVGYDNVTGQFTVGSRCNLPLTLI